MATNLTGDQNPRNDRITRSTEIRLANDVGANMIVNPFQRCGLNTPMVPVLRVKNYGATAQTNFPVVCSIVGAGGVLRYTSTETVFSLALDETTSVSFDTWTPSIAESCTVKMGTNLTGDENQTNDRMHRSIFIADVFYDFEANNGGFVADPDTGAWEWGVPTSGPNMAYSGTKLWATVLGGYYPLGANWKLISPEFTATADSPQLVFEHWYNIRNTYDGGNVKISVYGGPWTVITPVIGYPGYAASTNASIPNQPCFMGFSDWTEITFNLPVITGQRFRLRWDFGSYAGSSNSSYCYGWYIDDITGYGFAVLPPPANDVGVDAILSPSDIYWPSTPMTPSARVKNYGTLAQNNFPVVCSIVGQGGIRYTTSQTVTLLAAGDTTRINFPSWTPTIAEICKVVMRTDLAGDELPFNDRQVEITNVSPIVIIGTGLTNSYSGPMDRYHNYSTFEAIYRQGEIGISGNITHIAFYKDHGSDVNPIVNAAVYLKHTTDTTLVTGVYSLTGYTQVFSGSWTNDAPSGWMDVALTTPFHYNNIDNLQILIIKGYQDYISTTVCPYWRYTATPAYRTRQASNDASQPTNLTQTYARPNIRLELTSMSSITEHSLNNGIIVAGLNALEPNPATYGFVKISFTIAEPTKASLEIYDSFGRLVRTLIRTNLARGVYNLTWNGTDGNHREVAKGVYFFALRTDKQNFVKKLVMTR
jgi:hypothetical protein